MTKLKFLVVAALFVSAGCYHATIDTGRTPSPTKIEKHWASGWIYGLVPPSTIETAQKCPSGVARVETQLSFANQLVNFLTFGIYTPMDIVVTCAQGGTSSLPVIQAGSDKVAALESAVEMSQDKHTPVLVKY
ncbi:MAG TPA: Bor family protein [Gemmatimonadaceae bacterium]